MKTILIIALSVFMAGCSIVRYVNGVRVVDASEINNPPHKDKQIKNYRFTRPGEY